MGMDVGELFDVVTSKIRTLDLLVTENRVFTFHFLISLL